MLAAAAEAPEAVVLEGAQLVVVAVQPAHRVLVDAVLQVHVGLHALLLYWVVHQLELQFLLLGQHLLVVCGLFCLADLDL